MKLIVGFVSGSLGIIADSLHSLLDAASSVLAYIGIKASKKPPDESHPYGHQKAETISGAGITSLLALTAILIFYEASKRLFNPIELNIGILAFSVIILSIFTNEWLARYKFRVGRDTFSVSLIADAQHSRADVFSSIAVLFGLTGIRLGFNKADPIAAVIVAFIILKSGFGLGKEMIDVLMDASPGESVIECIRESANSIESVIECHNIRARKVGEHVFVDLHIEVDGSLSVKDGHDISNKVEKEISKCLVGVKSIVVHVEPLKDRH